MQQNTCQRPLFSLGIIRLLVELSCLVLPMKYGHFIGCSKFYYLYITPELTRPPTRLATNLAGSKMFGKHRKNAAARGSALNELLGYFRHLANHCPLFLILNRSFLFIPLFCCTPIKLSKSIWIEIMFH